MNYLIIYQGKAFYTNWYDYENNYVLGMIVINLFTVKISFDGKTWNEIEEDHL